MDFGPLRPYMWALHMGVFVPVSWILAVAQGPAAVVSDGRSNSYKEGLLVMVYAVIAVACLFHPA